MPANLWWRWPIRSNTKIILEAIEATEGRIMAKLADFEAALAAIDAETTRIADYIKELLEKLAAGGMTPEEEALAHQKVQAALERLKGVGTSVEQPVPPGDLPPV